MATNCDEAFECDHGGVGVDAPAALDRKRPDLLDTHFGRTVDEADVVSLGADRRQERLSLCWDVPSESVLH
jgi:hypothetical protein